MEWSSLSKPFWGFLSPYLFTGPSKITLSGTTNLSSLPELYWEVLSPYLPIKTLKILLASNIRIHRSLRRRATVLMDTDPNLYRYRGTGTSAFDDNIDVNKFVTWCHLFSSIKSLVFSASQRISLVLYIEFLQGFPLLEYIYHPGWEISEFGFDIFQKNQAFKAYLNSIPLMYYEGNDRDRGYDIIRSIVTTPTLESLTIASCDTQMFAEFSPNLVRAVLTNISGEVEGYRNLPTSLRSLRIIRDDGPEHWAAIISNVPHSLADLTLSNESLIYSSVLENYTSLPPFLTALTMGNRFVVTADNIMQLPKSLTSLSMYILLSEGNPLKNIYENLKALRRLDTGRGSHRIDSIYIPEDDGLYLSPLLEELRIVVDIVDSTFIKRLPRSLRILDLSASRTRTREFIQSLYINSKDFPPLLEDLRLHDIGIRDTDLGILPSTLQRLEITINVTSDVQQIQNLADTITDLNIKLNFLDSVDENAYIDVLLANLPPYLRKLTIDSTSKSTIINPHNIKYLPATLIDLHDFKMSPDNMEANIPNNILKLHVRTGNVQYGNVRYGNVAARLGPLGEYTHNLEYLNSKRVLGCK